MVRRPRPTADVRALHVLGEVRLLGGALGHGDHGRRRPHVVVNSATSARRSTSQRTGALDRLAVAAPSPVALRRGRIVGASGLALGVALVLLIVYAVLQ